MDLPEKRVATFKVPVFENGVRVWRDMKEYDTSDGGAHASWPENFFARIVDEYLAATANRGGKVGNATSHLIDARGPLRSALSVMERVASAH